MLITYMIKEDITGTYIFILQEWLCYRDQSLFASWLHVWYS